MSDLSATNCGCGCENMANNCGCGGGMSSCLWIILLLIFCGGCGNGCGGFGGRSDGCGCGNDSCLWIILLLIFCGGCGNGCGGFGGRGDGCGCGC